MRPTGASVALVLALAGCGREPIKSSGDAENELRKRAPNLTVGTCERRNDSTSNGWVCDARDGAKRLRCDVALEVQREGTIFCDKLK